MTSLEGWGSTIELRPRELSSLARLVGEGLDRRGSGRELARLEAGGDLARERERLALLVGTEDGVDGGDGAVAVD